MKLLALVPISLALAAPALAQQRPELPPAAVSPFPAFMAGDWVQRDGERWTEESWADRGARMMGMSREGTGETVRSRETLTIEPTPDGIVYIAEPTGSPAVVFAVTAQDDSSVEFANPAHDYPQRIRYWRDGDTLHAEIALLDGSNARTWTYQPRPPLKP